MKMKGRNFQEVVQWITLVLMLFLASTVFGQVPAVSADFPTIDTEIPITQWQLLGPFRFEKQEMSRPDAERGPIGLNRDYLEQLGQNEASIDENTFPSAKSPKEGVVLEKQFTNKLTASQPKTNILTLASHKRPFDYAVAYAAALIESPRDQQVVIAGGSDDGMQIRLNHELIYADPNTVDRNATKFNRLIGATLKKGRNFLLVKVANLTGDWQLIMTLFPHEKGLTLAQENGVNPILSTSVVNPGEGLVVRTDLLPQGKGARIEVTDRSHVLVYSSNVLFDPAAKQNLPRLEKEGLYYCRVSFGGESIERPFYYGDLKAEYSLLLERANHAGSADQSVGMDVQGELTRLKHLMQPSSRPLEFWDQKVAAIVLELENGLSLLEGAQGSTAFKPAPGTHIRAYRSSVDGQVQYYWLHVPEKAAHAGSSMPLVIALPFTTSRHQPFLESYFLAAFDETERYRSLGDDYGFAVLQVWGRGNHAGSTALGTADVFEALDDVRASYKIDVNRIYLIGYCEGGRLALLLGERYPNHFAAISTDAPVTMIHGGPQYAATWLQYSSPISSIDKLRGIPVLVRHDEADTPPPFQESAIFASHAREMGVDVSLVETHGGVHGFYQNPMAEKRALFEFFRGKEQRNSPLKLTTNKVTTEIRGPIEDAFGSPTLIVEGTGGDPAQHGAVHDLVQELLDEWRESYFVDCPSKLDTEVNDNDIRNYNLLIVGDSTNNALARRMSDELPLRVSTDGISLAGKSYAGTQLGYEFIAPNPLNRGKYVVVVGMSHWQSVPGWKLNPSRDGICDYFVFDLSGAAPRLKEAAYFDKSIWQQENEQRAVNR